MKLNRVTRGGRSFSRAESLIFRWHSTLPKYSTFQQVPQLRQVQLVVFCEHIDGQVELGEVDAVLVHLPPHVALLDHDPRGLLGLSELAGTMFFRLCIMEIEIRYLI